MVLLETWEERVLGGMGSPNVDAFRGKVCSNAAGFNLDRKQCFQFVIIYCSATVFPSSSIRALLSSGLR